MSVQKPLRTHKLKHNYRKEEVEVLTPYEERQEIVRERREKAKERDLYRKTQRKVKRLQPF